MTDLKPCPSRPYGDDPRVQALVDALVCIDAIDPEAMIDACSSHAIRGLVLRMGETARAALKQWEDGE